MPSSRGPSSRNSNDFRRMSSSLLQAGQSIAFSGNKKTIEDAPSINQEKRNLAQRLQDFEDKRKNEESKLMEEYDVYEKKLRGKAGGYSPPKGTSVKAGRLNGKREESYAVKSRKKVDYSDKIKELEARLFGK
jgi:hypothetical protein